MFKRTIKTKTINLITLSAGIFLSSIVASSAQDNSSNALLDVMKWWSGDYNNDAQLEQLQKQGKPIWRAPENEDDEKQRFGGHIEVTSHYKKVDLPAFGENVLYVEETKHGDPSNMFRQRIYTLWQDEETGNVKLKLWYFKDREKYVGAWNDLDKIANLTPDEFSPLPDNCDMTSHKHPDGKYHLTMPAKACVFGESYFDYQVIIGPDTFEFRDRIVRVKDDHVMSSAANFSFHMLDKIK